MSTKNEMAAIIKIMSGQWGMITAAQMAGAGVSREKISILTGHGILKRVRRGVYLIPASPYEQDLTQLRAAWLSLLPEITGPRRRDCPEADFIISGDTAAWLHGFPRYEQAPPQFMFSHKRPLTTARAHMLVIHRALDPSDIEFIDGLPVTTKQRTLLDINPPAGSGEISWNLLFAAGFFRNMTPEETTDILKYFHFTSMDFPAKKTLWRENDILSDIIILEDGVLHSVTTLPTGRIFIGHTYERQSVVALEVSLSAKRTFHTEIRSLQNGRLHLLPLADIKRLPESLCLKLMNNLIVVLCDNSIRFANQADIMSFRSIRDRLIKYFELCRQHQGGTNEQITIHMNQVELSNHLSVCRAALTDTLNKMRKSGEIHYSPYPGGMTVVLAYRLRSALPPQHKQ
jgi:CRP-like cAMP-binding protein